VEVVVFVNIIKEGHAVENVMGLRFVFTGNINHLVGNVEEVKFVSTISSYHVVDYVMNVCFVFIIKIEGSV